MWMNSFKQYNLFDNEYVSIVNMHIYIMLVYSSSQGEYPFIYFFHCIFCVTKLKKNQ